MTPNLPDQSRDPLFVFKECAGIKLSPAVILGNIMIFAVCTHLNGEKAERLFRFALFGKPSMSVNDDPFDLPGVQVGKIQCGTGKNLRCRRTLQRPEAVSRPDHEPFQFRWRKIAAGKCNSRYDPHGAGRPAVQTDLPDVPDLQIERKAAHIKSVAAARAIVPHRTDQTVLPRRWIPLIAKILQKPDRDPLFAFFPFQRHRARHPARSGSPAGGMQQIQHFHTIAGNRDTCAFQPVREVDRAEDQHGLAVVFRRINHTERHICITLFPEIESGGIVVRSLIGPTADTVFFPGVGKSHVGGFGKIRKVFRRTDIQIPDADEPAGALHSERNHKPAIGRNGKPELLGAPCRAPVALPCSRIELFPVFAIDHQKFTAAVFRIRQTGYIFPHHLHGKDHIPSGVLPEMHRTPDTEQSTAFDKVRFRRFNLHPSILQRYPVDGLLPRFQCGFRFQRNRLRAERPRRQKDGQHIRSDPHAAFSFFE